MDKRTDALQANDAIAIKPVSKWYYLRRILIILTTGSISAVVTFLYYNEVSKILGITCFVLCLSMLCIITYDSSITEQNRLNAQEIGFKDKMKFILHTTWKKKSLYFPIITHFADMSSDIAVIFEFYTLSQLNDDNPYDINYNNLFVASLLSFLLYRIVTASLYFFFSRNKWDFVLQIFDLLIFKILHQSWTLGLNEASWIQQYISLLEALFESSVQALISIYVILKVGISNVHFIIIVSQLFSLISISNAQVKEDRDWFTPQSLAKDIQCKCVWKVWKRKHCTNKRLLCCNWRYLIRVFWRYIDTILRIVLCGLVWIHFSGLFLILSLLFEFMFFVVIGNLVGSKFQTTNMINCEDKFELYLFAGLLSALPNGADCNGYSAHSAVGSIYSWYRQIIWNVAWIAISFVYEWQDRRFLFVLCSLCTFNLFLYIMFTSRRMCACGNPSNKCKPWQRDPVCGYNWTYYELSTTRNLIGCRTVKQVETLFNFGMKVHVNTVKCPLFWQRCLEPFQLLKYFEREQQQMDLKNLRFYRNKSRGILQWLSENPYFTKHKQVGWEMQNYCDELVSYLINDLQYDGESDHKWVLEEAAWFQTNAYLLQSYVKYNVRLTREYDYKRWGIKWHIDHNTTATQNEKLRIKEIIKENFNPNQTQTI